jgi:hypothetical protein
MSRILATTGVIVTLLSIAPALAAAKSHAAQQSPAPVYTYTARIDCGSGPVTVLSTDDMYAPLYDAATGRSYQPVAWNVVYNGRTIQDTMPGGLPKHARLRDCSYDDGGAVGTVTIVKPRGHAAQRSSHRR